MTDVEIQKKAEEIAAKYNTMKYRLGSVRKYSGIEWTEELDKFLAPIDESYKTKIREKFLSIVGLDGDQDKAHDKFLRDFPG